MDKTTSKIYCEVLVIGAGIAGLMAGRHLHARHKTVTLVDCEERVGGRILTEHIGGGWADTGAQFFTAREPAFQAFVDAWLAEGLIFPWSSGWSDGSTGEPAKESFPRYAAKSGMTALPRHLAQDLNIHKAVTIEHVAIENEGWTAVARSGEIYQSRALILTSPVPQSLALLAAGDVLLADADQAALQKIAYAPGITAVCHVKGQVNLPEPGAIQRPDYRISWIADNQRKGVSPRVTLITLQTNPDYSRLWWLSPDQELQGALRRELQPYLDPKATIEEIYLHRWPYALPTTLHPERTLMAANLPPLAFAGDAFHGPRIEGAALSGLAAAEAILPHL